MLPTETVDNFVDYFRNLIEFVTLNPCMTQCLIFKHMYITLL